MDQSLLFRFNLVVQKLLVVKLGALFGVLLPELVQDVLTVVFVIHMFVEVLYWLIYGVFAWGAAFRLQKMFSDQGIYFLVGWIDDWD